MRKISEPLTMVLIGATGDLAKKKIWKALYLLYTQDLLPDDFLLISNARAVYTRESFVEFVRDIIKPPSDEAFARFARCIDYARGDVTRETTFQDIRSLLHGKKRSGNLLWYIASLPSLYDEVIRHIGNCCLHEQPQGWVKFMLEKPFGTDFLSAQMLNEHLLRLFPEHHIYRIDHFLAKETVQNLLAFRFANAMFQHVWSREHIDHIQVNAAEDLGVEERAVFYDSTGTLRDVVQNHVLQMIAVTLMEQPASINEKDIRAVRKDLLRQLKPIPFEVVPHLVKFGQYEGYTSIPDLGGSHTETAVALKIEVDNDRWRGVPIYVRAGKYMKRSVTEITIQFKQTDSPLFWHSQTSGRPTALTLRIGPNEGVIFRISVKKPGIDFALEEVPMQFCYRNEFQIDLVEAYVKLIYDAIHGDPTLFPHADDIEASWKYLEPVLHYRSSSVYSPEPYTAGAWGPDSFDDLLTADGRTWIEPSADVCSISNIVRQR